MVSNNRANREKNNHLQFIEQFPTIGVASVQETPEITENQIFSFYSFFELGKPILIMVLNVLESPFSQLYFDFYIMVFCAL